MSGWERRDDRWSWNLQSRSVIRERNEAEIQSSQDDLNIPGCARASKGDLGNVKTATRRNGQREIAETVAETIEW